MILEDEQRRALEFIAAVNRGGYRPTGREINEWRRRPHRKPRRRGRMLQAAVPATPDRRVLKRTSGGSVSALANMQISAMQRAVGESLRQSTSVAQMLKSMSLADASKRQLFGTSSGALSLFDGREWETIPGEPGRPAVYAPDRPRERFLAHLRRLGWIDRDGRRRYSVTKLGHALLAVEAMAGEEDGDSSVVVLAPEDQKLGYGQVLGRISTCGDAVVVDHYLGVEELLDLLIHTDASRFIIGPNLSRDRVTELKVQIQLAPPSGLGVTRELRVAPLHDRYVVGEQHVYALTASLNGISKSSMAVLIEMSSVPAEAVREHVEELWSSGKPLARGLSTEDMHAEIAHDLDEDGVKRQIRQDDEGRFRHEGCTVRHKKLDAARNCTHGT